MTNKLSHDPLIALLAVPESTPFAIHGLFEVFQSVGRAWEDLTGEANTPATFETRIVARSLEPIVTSVGIPVLPQQVLGDADVVIVTDAAIGPDFDPTGQWPTEVAWLRERYAGGAIICSVCTGAVLLAEAGLLDGCAATSHWSAVALIKKRYPSIRLVPERILTADGDGDRIVTAGGASSWEELALYFVARFCGGEEAVRIAKIFLFGDRSEGQLPYAGVRVAHDHSDAVIANAQVWIADNYHRENPVAMMVSMSGLAERTFHRRFRAATGYSSLEYVQTMRIEEAKHQLETTDLSTETVAGEVGYVDPTYFRRLFRRRVGITPARYRQRFSTIASLASR